MLAVSRESSFERGAGLYTHKHVLFFALMQPGAKHEAFFIPTHSNCGGLLSTKLVADTDT